MCALIMKGSIFDCLPMLGVVFSSVGEASITRTGIFGVVGLTVGERFGSETMGLQPTFGMTADDMGVKSYCASFSLCRC